MHRTLAAVVIAVSLHAIPAQDPARPGTESPPPIHPEKQRVQEEILRKQDAIREGKVGNFNVRVRLRLHNGSRMLGVVKNGRFVEQEHGIDFVESDRRSPEAGVRLWYFDDSSSFVFLRWVDIESHKVLAKLSNEEVRAIEVQVAERDAQAAQARRLAAEAKAKAKAEAEATAAAESTAGSTSTPAPAPVAPPAPAPVPDLLKEFPPEQGWSEARAAEIERRKVVVGAYPNEQEQRFLDVLTAWCKARDDHAARTDKGGAPAVGADAKPATGAKPAPIKR